MLDVVNSHLAAAVLTAILLAPALASAAGPDTVPPSPTMSPPAIETLRRQLYREGQALGDAGKWDAAAEKFLKVVELRSAPKALIALGFAEEHTGHLLDADTHYRVAREDAVAAGNKADARDAQDSRTALAPRIPRLALGLPAGVDGIMINVDARLVFARSGEVLVDPGEHTVVIAAPKRVPYRVIIKMKEGERQEFSVALLLKPAPSEPPRPGGPPGAAKVLWIIGGAISFAGLFPFVVGRVSDDIKNSRTLDLVGGTMALAGFAVGGAGSVYWIVDANTKSPTVSRVQVNVTPGHNAVWVGVRGTY